MKELAETLRETALCGRGHSIAVPVLSSLENFPKEYERHIDKDYAQ